MRAAASRYGAVVAIPFLCWVVAMANYAAYGFSAGVFALWLIGIVGAAALLHRIDPVSPISTHGLERDAYAIAILLLLCIPAYMLLLYELPHQVTTDEISLMIIEQQELVKASDLFGISRYAGFPSLPFIVFANVADWLGGVNLGNVRLVHAGSGVLIALLAYVFFRQMLPRAYALGGALILGFNHALWGISRLAQWDNLSLLTLLLALILLVRMVRTGSLLIGFLGGAAAGLTWFVYPPARISIVIWGAFLLAIWGLRRLRGLPIGFGGATLAAVLGMMTLLGPLLIAMAKDPLQSQYYKYQLLLFPEGRQRQREWVRAETVAEGVQINVIRGLTAFNGSEHDQGFIYENRGHAFVDPLSGILLWVGVFYVARRVVRSEQRQDGDVLSLVGFTTLWLTFSFITNQSPNYTRLLVILPFVVYLVVQGLAAIAASPFWPSLKLPSRLGWASGYEVFAFGVALLVVWNCAIYADYLRRGVSEGNLVGGTARYVAERSHDLDHRLYIFSDQEQIYYGWGDESGWREWMGFFADDDQYLEVQEPEDCVDGEMVVPFTAFMTGQVWEECAPIFAQQYPSYQVHQIRSDGTRVAVEVVQ